MSTNPATEQLSAYLDGELDDAEAATMEAALEGSADLRAELDQLKGLQHLLRSHGPVRAPQGFAAAVVERAASENRAVVVPFWRRPFGIPVEGVMVAAAAALVLIVALPKGGEAPIEVAPAAPVEAAPAAPQGVDGSNDAVTDAGEGGYGSGEGEAEGYGLTDPPKEGSKDAGSKSTPAPAPVVTKAPPPEAVDQGGEPGRGAMDNAAVVTTKEAPTTAAGGTAEAAPKPVLGASGVAVSLYSEDEEILTALMRLAGRFDGTVRSSGGQALKSAVLQDQVTDLYVDVPAAQASAFTQALRNLPEARVETAPSGGLVGGDTIKVPVRVYWVSNAPQDQAAPPNAAKQRSYDAEMSDVDQ